MTKYLLSGGKITPINVDFEDSFRIVYLRNDMSGKWTLYKEAEHADLFQIFETQQEAVDFQSKKVEKIIIDLQAQMKQVCENHAEFLKKYQI